MQDGLCHFKRHQKAFLLARGKCSPRRRNGTIPSTLLARGGKQNRPDPGQTGLAMFLWFRFLPYFILPVSSFNGVRIMFFCCLHFCKLSLRQSLHPKGKSVKESFLFFCTSLQFVSGVQFLLVSSRTNLLAVSIEIILPWANSIYPPSGA